MLKKTGINYVPMLFQWKLYKKNTNTIMIFSVDNNLEQTSVQFVKGVGPQRARLLKKLNIFSIADLLYHFPHRHEDRRHFLPISKVMVNEVQSVRAKVITGGVRYTRRGPSVLEVIIGDKTGNVSALWFNQPYLKDKFVCGAEVILYGKVEFKKDRLQIINPEYEFIEDTSPQEQIHTGRIVPVYPLTSQISQRQLRTIIKNVLDLHSGSVLEVLPPDLQHRLNLVAVKQALRNIHFPENGESYRQARDRLIFDEFFLLEIVNAYRKNRIKTRFIGIAHKKPPELDSFFSGLLSFRLTRSQEEVINEIQKDMMSSYPMYRLLQGDVGCGKTVVALYAALLSVLNGYQTAFMVPTEILAEQHFNSISCMLKDKPCKIVLVKGGLRQTAKAKIYKEIEEGNADIVIGTHALIQEGVKFKKLGLCVIDEQHKFGVLQRKALTEKGQNPDILVMTATPIPRTLSMVLYSDMDVSVIKELPLGRKPITTWCISEKKRIDAYYFIKKEITGGEKQAYIVYPIVEQSEKLDLRDATRMYELLKKEVFKELTVGLVHGKLPSKQKEEIMRDFKSGKINILVSTIVIEVGIDVPNASVMLIEHAERFGLAQLHQLRGRIGRGEFKSCCILVSNVKSMDANLRMSAMVKHQSGFDIAEKDLQIRGPGEFFGIRQHGFPEFKIADPLRDIKVLEAAKKEAFALIDKDPVMEEASHKFLRAHVEAKLKFEE
ncbi:MAG: ATP-dependent DNA helicase RecG [Candidatus Omnitrophota bacterium]